VCVVALSTIGPDEESADFCFEGALALLSLLMTFLVTFKLLMNKKYWGEANSTHIIKRKKLTRKHTFKLISS
jgi:hypothetical protein